MSEYNEGDRLRAEKGETVIEGKAWNDCSGAVMIGSSGWSVERLIKIGFTITVIEKAKPKLPEEPGFYVEAGKPASMVNIWQLSEGGRWLSAASGRYDDRAAQFAPFTKLEPVAETAKKVLGAIRTAYMTDDPTYWGMLDKIAADFGVAK